MARRLWLSGFALAALGFVAGCGGTHPPAGPPSPPTSGETARATAAEVDRFRDALESHGQWIDIDPYGLVWAPLGVRADWRPYMDGRWVYTELGWLWLGEEPWAWAVYHYGRWLEEPNHGWVWVPSPTWGPAWVAWRRGQGWIGWAPLPPGARWSAAGLSMDVKELEREIAEHVWSFVPARDFMSSKLRARIAPVGRNKTLLHLTMNVTRYAVSGTRPAERGMTAEGVGAIRPPRPMRVTSARTGRINRAEIVSSAGVEVYRPELIREGPGRDRPYSSARAAAGPTIDELRARDRREQMKLDQVLRMERDRLSREQEKEARTLPQGISKEALKRRHENEIKAQARFEEELREQAAKRNQWLAAGK